MAFDEEFAFVTASVVGESHFIRYYLFAVEDSNLHLLVHGFEGVRHPIQAINQAAPNINAHLLPFSEIGLGQHSLLPSDDSAFAQIIAALQTQGHIQPENQPTFAAATEDFAYLVFAGGGVLMVNAGTNWVLQTTVGWQQAEARMWELVDEGQVPPLYILRQD